MIGLLCNKLIGIQVAAEEVGKAGGEDYAI
jgi:hypothetical protein